MAGSAYDSVREALDALDRRLAVATIAQLSTGVRAQLRDELLGIQSILRDEAASNKSGKTVAPTEHWFLLERVKTMLLRVGGGASTTSTTKPVSAVTFIPALTFADTKHSASNADSPAAGLPALAVPTGSATVPVVLASARARAGGSGGASARSPTVGDVIRAHILERDKHNVETQRHASAAAAAAATAAASPKATIKANGRNGNGNGNGNVNGANGTGMRSRGNTANAAGRAYRARAGSTEEEEGDGYDDDSSDSENERPDTTSQREASTTVGADGADPVRYPSPLPVGSDGEPLAFSVNPTSGKRRKFWKRTAMKCVDRYNRGKATSATLLSNEHRTCCLAFSWSSITQDAAGGGAGSVPTPEMAHAVDADVELAFIYFFCKVRGRNMRVANLILSFIFMLYAVFSFSRDFSTPVLVVRGLYILVGVVFFCGSFSQLYRNWVQYYGLVLSLLTGVEVIVEGAIHESMYSPFLIILLLGYIVAFHTLIQVRFKFACIAIISIVCLYDLIAGAVFPKGDDNVDAEAVGRWLAWYNVALIGISIGILKAAHRAEGMMRDEFLSIYCSVLMGTPSTAAPLHHTTLASVGEDVLHHSPTQTDTQTVAVSITAPDPTASGNVSGDGDLKTADDPTAVHTPLVMSPVSPAKAAAASAAAAQAFSWRSEQYWRHKLEQFGHLLHSQFTSERVLAQVKRSGAHNLAQFFEALPEDQAAAAAAAATKAKAASGAGPAADGKEASPAVELTISGSAGGPAVSAPSSGKPASEQIPPPKPATTSSDAKHVSDEKTASGATAAAAPAAPAAAGNSTEATSTFDQTTAKLKRMWQDLVQSIMVSASRGGAQPNDAAAQTTDATAAPAPVTSGFRFVPFGFGSGGDTDARDRREQSEKDRRRKSLQLAADSTLR